MSTADTDPVSTARRVADSSTLDGAAEFLNRYAKTAKLCGDASMLARAIATLKPILDFVAAGPDGDRIERWARVMCEADGQDPERGLDPAIGTIAGRGYIVPRPMWKRYEDRARAALALADAEAAARREAGWQAYEEARDDYRAEIHSAGSADYAAGVEGGMPYPSDEDRRQVTLDAAVRALTGS